MVFQIRQKFNKSGMLSFICDEKKEVFNVFVEMHNEYVLLNKTGISFWRETVIQKFLEGTIF